MVSLDSFHISVIYFVVKICKHITKSNASSLSINRSFGG